MAIDKIVPSSPCYFDGWKVCSMIWMIVIQSDVLFAAEVRYLLIAISIKFNRLYQVCIVNTNQHKIQQIVLPGNFANMSDKTKWAVNKLFCNFIGG